MPPQGTSPPRAAGAEGQLLQARNHDNSADEEQLRSTEDNCACPLLSSCVGGTWRRTADREIFKVQAEIPTNVLASFGARTSTSLCESKYLLASRTLSKSRPETQHLLRCLVTSLLVEGCTTAISASSLSRYTTPEHLRCPPHVRCLSIEGLPLSS